MVFLSPAFVLIALSALFASGSGQVDLALWDHDRTVLSRQFLDALGSDADFSLNYVTDYEEIDALLVSNDVDAAVVIPPGFSDAMRSGETASVQVILNGVDTFSARQAMGSLSGHAADFGLALSRQLLSGASPLQVESRSAYLDGNGRRDSMISGLIPLVFSLPAMAAALALARERESGSLESLVTTPVRGLEYLGGKLVAYVSTTLVGLIPVWLVATLLFGVPFRGNPLLFIAMTALFLMASMAQAIYIGSRVGSQQTATVIALFVFFVPGFFLAGLLDPIDTTNIVSTGISYLLPATHFVTISRALFIKGATFPEIWRSALALLGITAGWFALGAMAFKKQIAT
jgi:ABC-type multidrug transport system permease subunit